METRREPVEAVPSVLRNHSSAEVWRIIAEISDDLERRHHGGGLDPAPSGGLGGAMLLNRYMFEVDPDPLYERRAEAYLDHLLASTSRLPLTHLYGGTVGIAWLLTHLSRLEGDSEPDVHEMDDILMAVLEQPWRGHHDIVSGLAGIGIYALERLPHTNGRAILGLVVERFATLIEANAEGVAAVYTSPEFVPPLQKERHPNGYYDLGLAHGNPGCIRVLAGAAQCDVLADRARSVLDRMVPWLISQYVHVDGQWLLPGMTGAEPPKHPRLAWCYNELGAATAIMAAGAAPGRADWNEAAARVFHGSRGTPTSACGCRDACLCHGTAGVAQIYLRAAHGMSDPCLEREARRWLDATIALRRRGEFCGGYAYFDGTRCDTGSWDARPGFLEGSAGIGLALLAGTRGLGVAGWDRLLGLP